MKKHNKLVENTYIQQVIMGESVTCSMFSSRRICVVVYTARCIEPYIVGISYMYYLY